METLTANHLLDHLLRLQDNVTRKNLERFFKTGKGEYGEGDLFLGIKVPNIRSAIKPFAKVLNPTDVEDLVQSQYHEVRLAGLLIWVDQYKRAKSDQLKQEIVNLYLSNTQHVNNWDLVDLSSGYILGKHLFAKSHHLLFDLAASESLWEQRIAIVSTLEFIRNGHFETTLKLCDAFMNHKHDLIHKACGWCLREIGKKNESVLRAYLDQNAAILPRTALRYSIERLDAPSKQQYMDAKRNANK